MHSYLNLHHYLNYNTNTTKLTYIEIESLTNEFIRLADKLVDSKLEFTNSNSTNQDYREINEDNILVLNKYNFMKVFQKYTINELENIKCINKINNFDSNDIIKSYDFLTDSIYLLFDKINKNNLYLNEYLGCCDLFINGSIDEKLTFLYIICNYSHPYLSNNNNTISFRDYLDVCFNESNKSKALPNALSSDNIKININGIENFLIKEKSKPLRRSPSPIQIEYPTFTNSNQFLVNGFLSFHHIYELLNTPFISDLHDNVINISGDVFSHMSKLSYEWYMQNELFLKSAFGVNSNNNKEATILFDLLRIKQKSTIDEIVVYSKDLPHLISKITLSFLEDTYLTYQSLLQTNVVEGSKEHISVLIEYYLQISPGHIVVELGWDNLFSIFAAYESQAIKLDIIEYSPLLQQAINLFMNFSTNVKVLTILIFAIHGIEEDSNHELSGHNVSSNSALIRIWALIILSGSETFQSRPINKLNISNFLNEVIALMNIEEFVPYMKRVKYPFNSEADHTYALAGSSILKRRKAITRKIMHYKPMLLSPMNTFRHAKLPHSINSHQPQDSDHVRAHSKAIMKHFHFENGSGGHFGRTLNTHLSRRKSFIDDELSDSHSSSISSSPDEKIIGGQSTDLVIKIPSSSPLKVGDVQLKKFSVADMSQARIELFILDAFFYELHHDDQFHSLNPEIFFENLGGNFATPNQIFCLFSMWQKRIGVMHSHFKFIFRSNCYPERKIKILEDNTVQSLESSKIKSDIANDSVFILAFLLFFIASIEAASFYMSNIPGLISTEIVAHYNVELGAMGMLGSFANIGWMISLFITEFMVVNYGIHVACKLNFCIQSIAAAVFIISAYLKSYELLVVGFLVFGLGDLYLIVAVLVSQYFPNSVGLAFSLASAYYMFGTAIGSYLNPIIVSTYGMTAVWFLLAVLTLFSILSFFTMTFIEGYILNIDHFKIDGKIGNNWAHLLNVTFRNDHNRFSIAESPNFKPSPFNLLYTYVVGTLSGLLDLWNKLKDQPITMWIFLSYVFLSGGSTSSPLWYIPGYIENKFQFSSSISSTVSYGAINIGSILLTPLIGRYFDKHGNRFPYMILFFSLEAVSIIVLTQSNIHPILFSIFYIGCYSGSRCFGVPLLSLIVDPSLISHAATLYMVISGLGATSFSLITSSLLKSNGFDDLWYFCYALICGTVLILIILWIADSHHSRSELNLSQNRFRLLLPKITLKH